jgi:hypothetical protein
MKRNPISMRAAVVALGALCGLIMLPSISHAGAVSVNGSPVCTATSTNLTLNPAGDVVITCTAPSSGPATTVPVCSVAVSAASITTGGTSSVTPVCNPAATSYTWTASAGAPAISGTGGTLSFPTAGTYTYTVQGTNTAGLGPISAAGTVVVTTGTPATGCTTTAVDGVFTGRYGQFNPAIPRGGYVSYELPASTTNGLIVMLASAPSTSSQAYLWTEFAVAKCPGDFGAQGVDAQCVSNGIAESMNMSPTWGAAETPGRACTMEIGKKYYLNVKNVYTDHSTPSCNVGTCWLVLQMHSN